MYQADRVAALQNDQVEEFVVGEESGNRSPAGLLEIHLRTIQRLCTWDASGRHPAELCPESGGRDSNRVRVWLEP